MQYSTVQYSTVAPRLTILLCCSKDVRLPVQLQRAMAAEAEAAREARAKVVTDTVASRPALSSRRAGDRGRGRAEGELRAARRQRDDRGEPRGAAAALPADTQQHLRGEEQHHHLPRAHGPRHLLQQEIEE